MDGSKFKYSTRPVGIIPDKIIRGIDISFLKKRKGELGVLIGNNSVMFEKLKV